MTAWVTLADLPAAQTGGSAGYDTTGRLYFLTLDGAIATTKVYRYTPGSNSWETLAAFPIQAASPTLINTSDGTLYAIAGGQVSPGDDPFYRYDVATDTWTALASVPNLGYNQAAAVGAGDIIYAFTGGSGAGLNEGYRYDTVSDTWTAIANTPYLATQAIGAADANGNVYLLGGGQGGNNVAVHQYDATNNVWVAKASMPTGVRLTQSCLGVDGLIYIPGGEIGFSKTAQLIVYNPATNTWTTSTAMPIARVSPGTVQADGTIYSLGGDGGSTDRVNAYSYTPPAAFSAGSAATVTATPAGSGSGTEAGSGGSAATVTVIPAGSGSGTEAGSGGSAATVTVTATGRGSGTDQIVSGSAATVTVTATGRGRAAITLSGAGSASLTVTATGAGQLAAGISGAVQDFPDWVPPHIILATDNIIYRPKSAGDALPFRPTFVGLGGWTSVIVIADVTATDTVATWRLALDWLVGGVSVRTVVVDALALPANTAGLAGAQIITPAYSDELRVSVEADAALGQLAFTLAATTRQLPTLITPARFPDDSTIPAPAGTVSIPANSDATVDVGPYSDALRLAVATDTDLTLTATTVAPVNGDGAAQQLASVDAAAAGVTALPVTWQGRVLRYSLHNGTAAAAAVTRQVDTVPA